MQARDKNSQLLNTSKSTKLGSEEKEVDIHVRIKAITLLTGCDENKLAVGGNLEILSPDRCLGNGTSNGKRKPPKDAFLSICGNCATFE